MAIINSLHNPWLARSTPTCDWSVQRRVPPTANCLDPGFTAPLTLIMNATDRLGRVRCQLCPQGTSLSDVQEAAGEIKSLSLHDLSGGVGVEELDG